MRVWLIVVVITCGIRASLGWSGIQVMAPEPKRPQIIMRGCSGHGSKPKMASNLTKVSKLKSAVAQSKWHFAQYSTLTFWSCRSYTPPYPPRHEDKTAWGKHCWFHAAYITTHPRNTVNHQFLACNYIWHLANLCFSWFLLTSHFACDPIFLPPKFYCNIYRKKERRPMLP